ncbi:MAG: SDR family oxidoreductase [Deltaproteobacteria bacterium]|nr:MAG: SDR family oxidoreductase [Deltaproteobacteria bacterium]
MWQDKGIIVIGATAGLAESTLMHLAEQGASLVLHGRNKETLQQLQNKLPDSASTVLVQGDVTDPSLGSQLWSALQDLPGTPFGFLCFVGIPGRLAQDEWTPQALSDIFAVNCAGPLLLCRHWAEQMRAHEHTGNAVLFSTMQANYPFEGSLPYSLGKVALQHGIQILAKEVGNAPVLRVNGIAPGVNEAGMALASIQRGKYQPYVDDQRIPRYGTPQDILQAVSFLLQPDLYMTGQTLLLDGGFTLRRDQA